MELAESEIAPLHSSLGDRARLCLKKEKGKKEGMKQGRRDEGTRDQEMETILANTVKPHLY